MEALGRLRARGGRIWNLIKSVRMSMQGVIRETIGEYDDPILIDVKISGDIYIIIDDQIIRPGDKIVVKNPKTNEEVISGIVKVGIYPDRENYIDSYHLGFIVVTKEGGWRTLVDIFNKSKEHGCIVEVILKRK